MALVLNVFCDAAGGAGNPLGVVLDAEPLEPERRQRIAAELGYSETIFVEAGARIAIHTPTIELPFAGHPLVGAAWLLGAETLHPPAGPVRARARGDHAWIEAPAALAPPWDLEEVREPDAVSAPQRGHVMVWAWEDEARGRVRARVFAPDYGVPEDPATGSAAIALCAHLDRELTISQGTPASELRVRPLGAGVVELGGRVVRS